MDCNFKDKRVLVTGAGRGIGREIAIALAKHGAEVVAVSKTQENLESLKKEVPSIQTVVLDVNDWERTKHITRTLLPLDLLVNNAGVISLQPVGEVTEDEFDRVFNINVKALLNISQVFAENLKMREAPGTIVNISSQAATIAIERHIVYCASKAAVDQITKVMALELGPQKIRVNSVNPTVLLTDMGKSAIGNDPTTAEAYINKIPLRRFCDIEDVVNAVLFLLSEKSSMITGACLPIDGGYTIY